MLRHVRSSSSAVSSPAQSLVSNPADPGRRSVLRAGVGIAAGAALWGLGGQARAAGTLPFAGLNLSGLASNNFVDNALIDRHYRDISDQHIVAAGACPLFRLPTTAARFSTGQGMPLNATYCDQVEKVLGRLAQRGKVAILELHDYMRLPIKVASKSGYRRDGAGQLIGPDGRAVADPADQSVWNGTYRKGNFLYLAYFDPADNLLKLYEYRVIGTPGCTLYNAAGLPDLWSRIVQRFRSHPAIFGWGLMNEPYQGPERNADGSTLVMADHWLRTATATAARIFDFDRSHYVFVCGNEYASARRWKEASNNLDTIPDPYDRIVYEAHNYLDDEGRGGGAWANPNESVAPDTGIEMVKPFIDWLGHRGKRGFLGEHGYPAGNASAELATKRMLAHLQANNIPSTQWCFGPGWPDNDVLGMSRDVGMDIQVKSNIAAVQPYFDARLSSYVPPPPTS